MRLYPPDDLAHLQLNTTLDGFFHAVTWDMDFLIWGAAMLTVGASLLRARREAAATPASP